MTLNPERWTMKTQEALASAVERARDASNAEVSPAHLLAAVLDQADGIAGPILTRVGVEPAVVRARIGDELARLPQAFGGAEPTIDRDLRDALGRRRPPAGRHGRRVPVGRAPAAGTGRPAGCGARRAADRAARRARQPPGHLPEPRGDLPGPREVRAGPDRPCPSGEDGPGHRTRRRGPPGHPGPVPPDEEQPGPHRRARGRQDGHRRGPGPADRRGRRARGAEGKAGDQPRHGLDDRRGQVPGRVRGAAEGRPEGDHRRRGRGHHLHRRAPHHRGRRRCRGGDGRRQHDQAHAGAGRAADDRCHDARRVPEAHREGRGARAPLPAGLRAAAVGARTPSPSCAV